MRKKILSKMPVVFGFFSLFSFCFGAILSVSNIQGELLPDKYPIDSNWKVLLFLAFFPILGVILAVITWAIWGEEKQKEDEEIYLEIQHSLDLSRYNKKS